jgi:hypothetical protein
VDLTAEEKLLAQVSNQRSMGGKLLLRAIRSLVVSMSSSGWHIFEHNFFLAKRIAQKPMPVANHGTLKTSSNTSSFGVPPSLRQL